MAQHRAQIPIDCWVGLKPLHRALVTGGALQKEAAAPQCLLDHTFHGARVIRRNKPVGGTSSECPPTPEGTTNSLGRSTALATRSNLRCATSESAWTPHR